MVSLDFKMSTRFYEEALVLYKEMTTIGNQSNEIKVGSVLPSCTRLMEVLEGGENTSVYYQVWVRR